MALAFALLFLYGAVYFGLAYIEVRPETLTALGMWSSGPARDLNVKTRLPTKRTLRWSDIQGAKFSSVQGHNGFGAPMPLPALTLALKTNTKSVFLLQPFLTNDCRRLAFYMHQLGIAVEVKAQVLGKGFALG